jgi:adenylosuccinate synthase
VYEEVEGWAEDIDSVSSFDDLPAPARKYVERLQDLVGVQAGVVSVGPGREQSLPLR